ncbi:MAG TPA: DUF1761 domain-containing protein [Bacteroidia bacterium]|nr:DUF1761 domain-containing protein [Bacteroidia bacterium]
MENLYINHWAVLVCAAANLLLGGLWYSPVLFGKAWQRENKLSDEQLKNSNPAVTFTLTFILSYIISYNLAFFLGDSKTDASWGAAAGFLAGFGFSALIFAIIGLFEQRSFKYILINGGFITVYFTIIGCIIGAWR